MDKQSSKYSRTLKTTHGNHACLDYIQEGFDNGTLREYYFAITKFLHRAGKRFKVLRNIPIENRETKIFLAGLLRKYFLTYADELDVPVQVKNRLCNYITVKYRQTII